MTKTSKTALYAIMATLAVAVIFVLTIHYAPEVRCQTKDARYLNTTLSAEERINDLMNRMTTAEKIGQMTLIEKNSIHDANDISRYNLGGLLSGFGAKPDPNTPEGWLNMVGNFQDKTKNTCLKIPLIYGVDAIHGFSNVIGATIFPHFIGLGATHNPNLVRQVAKATREEMASTGIYWNFSPNLDVAMDTRWGRTYETFGSDTENVSTLGLAYLQGTQVPSSTSLPSIATIKHYIGNGATDWGSSINKDFKIDQGNVTISEEALRKKHLPPFQKAIDGGAQAVMIGLNSINGVSMSENTYLITDILKKELGFSGIAVSDWYGVYEVSQDNTYSSTVKSVNAGVDMIMLPYNYKQFKTDMERALQNGDINEERLNDAVRRILNVKFKLGLFERPAPTVEGLSTIGSQQHRDLARQAVSESQVLLKNKNNSLPLSTTANRIIVAGSGADNIGRQSGAWTIEWQGIDGNWIPGTTVLAGIKNTVSKNTEVDYNLLGDFQPKKDLADIGIAVVSEKPYAEGWGDNDKPSLSSDDLATIKKIKKQSKKLIVIIVSGRPLEISPYADDWDGIVASWLPGSEGQGVADVLFGLKPFTGKLPIKWND